MCDKNYERKRGNELWGHSDIVWGSVRGWREERECSMLYNSISVKTCFSKDSVYIHLGQYFGCSQYLEDLKISSLGKIRVDRIWGEIEQKK